MKYLLFPLCFLLFGYMSPVGKTENTIEIRAITDTIPVVLPSEFSDDYGIRYSISDLVWLQQPSTSYHILRWNKEKQYVIAKNGVQNKSDAGLYTRIDYMKFSGMEPYTWGFCLSVYKAASDSVAEFGPNKTDRTNPRKGRM